MTPKTCIHEPWEKCPCEHVASLGGAATLRMDPTIPAGLPADLRAPVAPVAPPLSFFWQHGANGQVSGVREFATLELATDWADAMLADCPSVTIVRQ
jgi:hypothetical protein